MNSIFQFFRPLSFVAVYNKYKPYINYTWSNIFQVANKMYSKNTGNSGQDLQLFSGQGCWFNGIDMQITVPVNATIQTEIKRVNGVVEINTNTQNLTNYNVYSGSGAKVYKDLYMFDRVLTQTEIDKYNNQPSQFFMDSLEDDSCILAMPMCEKDSFVRNHKSYSEGNNLVINGDFSSSLGNWSLTNTDETHIVEVVNGEISFNLGSTTVLTQLRQNINFILGKIYIIEYAITKYTSGSLKIDILGGNLTLATTIGKHKHCFVSGGSPYLSIYRNSSNVIMSLDNISIRELSSIYPITNYLATCRTNAQRLSYGLQTSGFKRDSNGVILSNSNFLECDGVGYCNTGWVPKSNEDFTVETVLEVSNDLEFRLNGNSFGNGVYFGENTTGNNLYVKVFGSPTVSITNSKNIVCLTFSYNWQSKEVKCYVDGVFNNTQLATQTNSTLPVLLGMVALSGTNYPLIKPIRLFKVHSKVLTQEEITKNFNKYQSQGLLNE